MYPIKYLRFEGSLRSIDDILFEGDQIYLALKPWRHIVDVRIAELRKKLDSKI